MDITLQEPQGQYTKAGFNPPENYPFKGDVVAFKKAMKENIRSTEGGGYKRTRVTVIEQTEYFPGSFAKLYQNKELLDDLSPEACKILVHIGLNMDYNSAKIRIHQPDTGLSRRLFPRAILELMLRRILAKEKKEWYWVNVTLLIVGNINKHE